MKLLLLYFILFFFPSYQIDQSKAIIIYFSRAGENYSVGKVDKGNTEMIVDYLKEVTDIATTFKINPETPYPENYQETVNLAREEKNSNARPKIKDPLTDISSYDYILLGYPIWHSDLPNIVMTQLELLDFEGKTIYPFNTHEGSGLGNSINDIKNSAPKATVKDGFALRGSEARKEDSHESIRNWLKDKLEIDISNEKSESNEETESNGGNESKGETGNNEGNESNGEDDFNDNNIGNSGGVQKFQNINFFKKSMILILLSLVIL